MKLGELLNKCDDDEQVCLRIKDTVLSSPVYAPRCLENWIKNVSSCEVEKFNLQVIEGKITICISIICDDIKLFEVWFYVRNYSNNCSGSYFSF